MGRLPAFASWPRSLDPMDTLCGSKFWVRRCPGTEGAHPRAPERALGRGRRREGVWPCHPHPPPDPCPGRTGTCPAVPGRTEEPGKARHESEGAPTRTRAQLPNSTPAPTPSSGRGGIQNTCSTRCFTEAGFALLGKGSCHLLFSGVESH